MPYVTAQSIALPSPRGTGLLVGDAVSSSYRWIDLKGNMSVRGPIGAGTPTWAAYRGNMFAYQWLVNDYMQFDYHIDHDLPSAAFCDVFYHIHWLHNFTTVTGGSVDFELRFDFGPGHNQGATSAEKVLTLTATAPTTQYWTQISELQITNDGGDATHIDRNLIEVDGIVSVRTKLTANNITVSGGAKPDPFIRFCDCHMLSTGIGTKNRTPNFYT